MLGLFKREPLLDAESIEWLFEAFGWTLRNFGTAPFYRHVILVTPTPEHFPGSGTSVEEMAKLMLRQVKHYAGVEQWPTQVVNHREYPGDLQQVPSIGQVLNALVEQDSASNNAKLAEIDHPKLLLFYEPQQVGAPEVMIANFAHALMINLAGLAELEPPCEEELLPHLTEVMAVAFGFGLMFANTANPYRGGGCARCVSPAMERVGNLSEREVAYALAIFAVLKEVPEKEVVRHLKKSLRGFFRQAINDVKGRTAILDELRSIDAPARVNNYS